MTVAPTPRARATAPVVRRLDSQVGSAADEPARPPILLGVTPTTRPHVTAALYEDGHEVTVAGDGTAALASARRLPPALLVLEQGLTGTAIFDICHTLRTAGDRRLRTVSVLLLGGVAGDAPAYLDAGADDYLAAPVSKRELQARVRAHLRRVRRAPGETATLEAARAPMVFGTIAVDPAARSVRRAGREVALTARSFDLLCFLLRHPGRVFTREQLLDRVWTVGYVGEPRTVDVHVRWLRQALERDPGRPELLETVRGVGYRARRLRRPATVGG
jgi:DNA-binding response OmpR family regulator